MQFAFSLELPVGSVQEIFTGIAYKSGSFKYRKLNLFPTVRSHKLLATVLLFQHVLVTLLNQSGRLVTF